MSDKALFAVGYPVIDQNEPFAEMVREYRDAVGEVYFAWPGSPSGRAASGRRRGYTDWGAQNDLQADLISLKKMGVKLDLLFNANCYGERSLSVSLANEVVSIIEYLKDIDAGPDVVTTTSLTIAYVIRNTFSDIELRASVNMKLGSPVAMRHVAGLFDSFYLQRDNQRNLEYAASVSEWCRSNGKEIGILANSGCLRNCPGQIFHDNTVAHDAAIDEMKNIPDWTPHVCWNRYGDEANRSAFLQSTWIRPEDIANYTDKFDFIKLATRMHTHPRMVIHAYATGSFPGNLLDLTEPGFSAGFAPKIIDNRRFPDDWYKQTSTCEGNCVSCSYCDNALETVSVQM